MTFVLDASGSVARRFELAQELTELVVMGLNFANDRTRVGVITYQAGAQIEFPLSRYNTQLEVFNAIAFKQDREVIGTNTADAIAMGTDEMFTVIGGDRSGVDDVMIVMSDGRSNMNTARTVAAAEAARNAGVRVMGVGIGVAMDMGEINAIASDPDVDNAFFMPEESDLQATANQILDQLCQ